MTHGVLSAPSVHDALCGLLESSRAEGVGFEHRYDLPASFSDDFRVTYEGVFQPYSIDQMRAAIWLTDQGRIGIGLETEARLVQRTGRRPPRGRQYQLFAWGFEPMALRLEGLLFLLDLVSRGEVSLEYPRSWWSLGSLRAVVSAAHKTTLRNFGLKGFRDRPNSDSLGFGLGLLEYGPWT